MAKKFILEMNEEKAKICAEACEFYARVRMGQFDVIPQMTLEKDRAALSASDFCDKRDAANAYLFAARSIIYPELKGMGHSYGVGFFKDADDAFDVYQALRGPLGDSRGVLYSGNPEDVPSCKVVDDGIPDKNSAKISAKEMAELLNGREYRSEMTRAEEALAKENGLVVVFGYSDDCCEMRGAIDEELDCFDGGDFYITKDGVVDEESADKLPNAKKLEAVWCGKETMARWSYKTDIPHEIFTIEEDDEEWCEGIVFHLSDV